jgi:tol-pal system protein YbgF
VPSLSDVSVTGTSGGGKVRESHVPYEKALSLLRQGNFEEAAREFSLFLQTSTNSPLASNAQYWLGECYYGQRRFQEAIDEFERVFAFYPSSNKVPASLLKIAYSHLELQQPTMARSVFQQLVRTYPQSPEAGRAYSRLQEVNTLLENPS